MTHFSKGKENARPPLSTTTPMTEYRKQFPLLPSTAYSKVLSSSLNVNNNNSNVNNNGQNEAVKDVESYDIISHFPTRSRTLQGEDVDDRMSPSSLDFLSRTSLPVPHLRPKSPVDSTYRTEYRSKFKPFYAFKYEDGAFREDLESVSI